MTKTEVNYENFCVYRIYCRDPDVIETYIGGTTDLVRRKSNHKMACSRPEHPQYNFRVYEFIREQGGWTNWSLEKIEGFPCQTRDQAREREQHWIGQESTPSLNTRRPYNTDNENRKSYNHSYYEHRKLHAPNRTLLCAAIESLLLHQRRFAPTLRDLLASFFPRVL